MNLRHRSDILVLAFLAAVGVPTRLAAAQPSGLAPAPPPSPGTDLPLGPQSAALPARGSPFAVRLAVDLPLTLGAGVLALTGELLKSELPGPGLGLDPQSINALDRTVVGNHSAAARTASDALVGVSVGLPLAFDLLDVLVSHPPDGLGGYGLDVLVLAEVFAVNAGLNSLVKFAVRRPRPLVYDPDLQAVSAADRSDPDSALSFYSQHSSTAFSLATAYSYLFMQRHPGSKLVVPVWLFSEGLAAATATLRVEAGKHFWTDVLTGAVVGSAVGLLIPYLHRRALPAGGPAFASRLRFSAAPLALVNGGGVLLTIE